jgi:hypothetical protein
MADTASAADLRTLAAAVATVGSDLFKLLNTWHELGLPGDAYTAETGYPFDHDLAEIAHEVMAWHDAIIGDADIKEGLA